MNWSSLAHLRTWWCQRNFLNLFEKSPEYYIQTEDENQVFKKLKNEKYSMYSAFIIHAKTLFSLCFEISLLGQCSGWSFHGPQ